MSSTLLSAFRKGITPAQLKNVEKHLAPLYVPDSVRKLWQWHDGADAPLELIPPYEFLSASQAIALYESMQTLSPGAEGWNPIWFPVFGRARSNYSILLSKDVLEDSPVLQIDLEDTDLHVIYPSLLSLLRASAECFSSGAIVLSDDYLESNEGAASIQAKHGNALALRSLKGVKSYSKHFTLTWPAAWREAIGRTSADYELRGAKSTIAAYLRSPSSTRVQATIGQLVGSGDESIFTISDASGTMTVQCPRAAIGSRETQIGRRFEFSLKPCKRRPSALSESRDMDCDAAVTHMVFIS
jgi:cell wall assembly regulator SMI1